MQPTTSADALSQLQSTQASVQDPNSILQAQNQALGVNSAQQTVTGLRGAINNTGKLLQQVAPSVMGRTGSSLVTNAQANRQIQNEQAPISQNLSDENTQYNQQNSDLQQLEQQAQQQASGIYQGQQDKLSYAQNLYNSLYKQEQDAAAQQYQQQQAAEQQREFNVSQANAVAAAKASSGSTFNLPGAASTGAANVTSPTTPTLSGGKSLGDASTALKQLLATNNGATIRATLSAIQKSAQYGNTYDQAKLQLINSRPEFAQYLANSNGASF